MTSVSPKPSAPTNENFVGRVLLLHGYTQSAGLFHSKTLALRKKLISLKLKPVYLNAPNLIAQTQLQSSEDLFKLAQTSNSEDDGEHNFRSWTERQPDAKFTFDLAKKTVDEYIKNGTIIEGTKDDEEANLILDKDADATLPIVGLIGFSQGASFGGAMIDKFQELYDVPPLKWAVLFSGFLFNYHLMPEHKRLYSTDKGISSKPTRILHVLGELDTVVSEERSMQLYHQYEEISTLLKHPGGHFVPNNRPFVEKVCNWIVTEKEETKEEKKPEEKSDLDSLLDLMKNFGG